MDHLGGIDASFLYLETPEMPMHVGGLNLFELPPSYQGDFLENVRRHIESRMHLAPVFQRKLLNMPFDLANPVWVAYDDLDLEYHIRSTVLPKPGNRAQLDHLVGRLHSSQLDRSRPLWEFYVIEGVQNPPDAPKGTRRVAFYSKVHHAALDGEGGAVLAQSIMDLGPVPRTVRPAPPRRPMDHDTYGIAELVGAGLKNSVIQTAKLARALPSLLRSAAQILRPAPGNPPEGAEAAKPGPANAPKGLKGALGNQWFGPRTPINVSVTNQRIFSSLSLPLADIKHIAKSHGVTLNDVVMAICSGALRHYLADLGCVPDTPLLAGVPVSLREKGNTEMNTQASMMRVSLASTVADPLERLQAIRQSSLAAKAMTASMKSAMAMDFPSLGAPWLISGMASLYSRSRLADRLPPVVNVAISNVPGPKFALYLAGAKMLTYYPVSIAGHSMALNVTVQSYSGSLDFGLTACRKAMPDLPQLARYMQESYEELRRLTSAISATATEHSPVIAAHPAPTKKAKAPAQRRAPAPKAAAVKTASGKTGAARKTAPRKTPVALQLAAGQPKPARAPRARRAAA
ncbi:MAG: wax ester/triacylglycerol synthase family O-acyltransferase [Burkholderiaceae bacterium]|nr:MAG: wax ester/triacylglycerol synthase family O-acyltransferase [Burkholderiaceae bacterium]